MSCSILSLCSTRSASLRTSNYFLVHLVDAIGPLLVTYAAYLFQHLSQLYVRVLQCLKYFRLQFDVLFCLTSFFKLPLPSFSCNYTLLVELLLNGFRLLVTFELPSNTCCTAFFSLSSNVMTVLLFDVLVIYLEWSLLISFCSISVIAFVICHLTSCNNF